MLSATVTAPGPNGLQMQLYADAPGLQLYTADGFNYNKTMAGPGKGGVYYEPYGGGCKLVQLHRHCMTLHELRNASRPYFLWAQATPLPYPCTRCCFSAAAQVLLLNLKPFLMPSIYQGSPVLSCVLAKSGQTISHTSFHVQLLADAAWRSSGGDIRTFAADLLITDDYQSPIHEHA